MKLLRTFEGSEFVAVTTIALLLSPVKCVSVSFYAAISLASRRSLLAKMSLL